MARKASSGALQASIFIGTLFTAVVHLYLVVTPHFIRGHLRLMFLLAGIGFLGTLAALYMPSAFLEPHRWLARLALMAMALGSIVAYFIVVGFTFSPLSLVDKLVEAALVVALVVDALIARGESRSNGERGPHGLRAAQVSADASAARR